MSQNPDLRPSLAVRFAEAREAALEQTWSGAGEGRGIVICAGGARLFTCAWVAVGLLRRILGCKLPIQIWHLGSEEFGPAMRDLMSRFDVEFVDAFEMARDHPVSRLAGWELKPYALMHCRFREVMLLDADNMPVLDPTSLFDSTSYGETGALFWPDLVRIRRDNPIWTTAGLEPWTRPSIESGQLIVDKARCWPAVVLTQWMNQNAAEFYAMIWGDKDTFLISWLATGAPFGLIETAPDHMEGILCQKGPDGELRFQHRTNAKWTLLGRAPAVEGYQLHTESVALLDELATEWDGWIFNPPARSEAARQMEAELERQGLFQLTRHTFDEKTVRLGTGHRISQGAAPDLVYWYVADADADLELILRQGGFVSARLTQIDQGRWAGQWLQPPYTPVYLTAAEPVPVARSIEYDASLERLLEDMRSAFESVSSDRAAQERFAAALVSIARVRPQAESWLALVARSANASQATRDVAGRALKGLGERGRRHRGEGTVQRLGLETTHGYDRD